jgi:hypothetical protein
MTDDSSDTTDERARAWESALEEDVKQTEGTENDKNNKDEQRTKDTLDTGDAMDTTATDDAKNSQTTQETSDAPSGEDGELTEWDVDSISSAWKANQVRLPDSIQTPYDAEHNRIAYELQQADADVNYSKDRYYKPLVIALGLQELSEADGEEIAELLEQLEAGELVE